MAIQTPATTKMVQNVIDGTTVPRHAMSAAVATNVTTQINGKAITNIFESDGLKVKNATLADNATNVTDNINGKAISNIFESDGITAKVANKLGTASVGTASRPVYLSSGVPIAIQYTLGPACQKSISDGSLANWLDSTNTDVPTVRLIYYALPKINGTKMYDDGDNYYAPTSVGTSGYVLKSNGSGAPSWANINMCPYSRVNISFPLNNGAITPSKNGFLCASKRGTAANQYLVVSQSGGAEQTAVCPANGTECSVCIPVKANTGVKFTYNAAGETVRAFFVFPN